MAGVTDVVFRRLCKRLGADVMVTEFVSAEGILRRDDRTRHYTEFDDEQRPVGVQLFGADGRRMGEAARKVIDWKEPDFIDLNFGCPVNKVVAKNGGSSLLRNCPLLESVASEVVRAVGQNVPVTAKIRIGWDQQSINAVEVARILENCGVRVITVHGRTRAQGYSGLANWEVIQEVAGSVRVPVIGNGDLGSGAEIERRLRETSVAGLMIGRAALGYPWIFREAAQYLATGAPPPPVSRVERWELMVEHCRMAVAAGHRGGERQVIQAMRSRLMAYSRGLTGGKSLRQRFCQVQSLAEVEDIADEHLNCSHEPGGRLEEEPALV
ncbi:MAG: tRNA dihydrouridine synthase DusB [Verrucomicrobia bacterium]|nr:tRNA dihydrouridine synthase DusB [Verrucomicrobiota bacterium]